MTLDEHRLPTFLTSDAVTVPRPDNSNRRLKDDWMTPAEVMQIARREKERLRRAIAANPGLVNSPKHRHELAEVLAFEQCALWHLYGARRE
jgi:hypothetical protein